MKYIELGDKKLKDKKLEKVLDKNKKKQIAELKNFAKTNLYPMYVGNLEKMNERNYFYHRKYLLKMGFIIKVDKGSVWQVILPKGWKKVPDKKSDTWIYLFDNKGRKRAVIFFKLLSAHDKKQFSALINYIPRYRVLIDRETKDNFIRANVVDGDNIIYSTDYEEYFIEKSVEDRIKNGQLIKKVFNDAKIWLNKRYLDNDNVSAYWDA